MDCPECEFENTDPLAKVCWECESDLNNDSIVSRSSFLASAYLHSYDEGGRQVPLSANSSIKFYVEGYPERDCVLELTDEMVYPGDTFEARINLTQSQEICLGLRFSLVEAGRLIASGTITSI